MRLYFLFTIFSFVYFGYRIYTGEILLRHPSKTCSYVFLDASKERVSVTTELLKEKKVYMCRREISFLSRYKCDKSTYVLNVYGVENSEGVDGSFTDLENIKASKITDCNEIKKKATQKEAI